jgi:hypothetical protein
MRPVLRLLQSRMFIVSRMTLVISYNENRKARNLHVDRGNELISDVDKNITIEPIAIMKVVCPVLHLTALKWNSINIWIKTRCSKFYFFTSRKVAGSNTDKVIGFFSIDLILPAALGPGVTQPLTEMSTRN